MVFLHGKTHTHDSHPPKKLVLSASREAFKNDEKCFLCPFHSENI